MFYLDMVDSIGSPETTGTPIPQAILKARAVAAYIAGNSWPTYGPYSHARPDLVAAGRLVSITLTASARARCLDIETGGASAGQAPGWFRNRADTRRGKPILYTFASNTHTVIDTMASAGVPRDAYYIWSAHFRSRFGKHMCGPGTCGYPQADITQWTDQVPENCDGSICESYVFAPVGPPPPPPLPREDIVALTAATNKDGLVEVFCEAQPAAAGKCGEVF